MLFYATAAVTILVKFTRSCLGNYPLGTSMHGKIFLSVPNFVPVRKIVLLASSYDLRCLPVSLRELELWLYAFCATGVQLRGTRPGLYPFAGLYQAIHSTHLHVFSHEKLLQWMDPLNLNKEHPLLYIQLLNCSSALLS